MCMHSVGDHHSSNSTWSSPGYTSPQNGQASIWSLVGSLFMVRGYALITGVLPEIIAQNVVAHASRRLGESLFLRPLELTFIELERLGPVLNDSVAYLQSTAWQTGGVDRHVGNAVSHL